MSYTIAKPYTLYRLEHVQQEIGVNDLMDWSRLVSDYDLNLKMTTYQGYTGMEEVEKDRLVRELKERLATMPEIEASVPAHKKPYGYKKNFSRPFTLYQLEDVFTECNLDGVNNDKKRQKVTKNWKPQPEIIEYNGHKGFTEQEKARLVEELEKLKAEHEARERQEYLEKLALQDRQVMPAGIF